MNNPNVSNNFNTIDTSSNIENLSTYTNQTSNQGKIDGMSIEIEDPLSSFLDNAEELTFSHDNSKKTKLADRKQKNAADLHLVKQAAFLSEILLKVQNSEFEAKKRILSRAELYKGNPKKLLSDLRNLGGSKTQDYAILQSTATKEKDPLIKEILNQAAESLFQENKSEIVSTLNALNATKEDSDLEERYNLCESYSELSNTCGTNSLKMMEYLASKFGENRIDEGVDFMLNALAADLNSPITSQEPVLLEDIGTTLSTVRMINSAKNICNQFVSRLSAQHGINTSLNLSKMISGLLNLSKQKFISSSDIRNLYSEVAPQRPDTEVLLAQDFLKMCRDLGSEFFDDESSRLRVVDAVINLVDDKIAAEDSWLENGGA